MYNTRIEIGSKKVRNFISQRNMDRHSITRFVGYTLSDVSTNCTMYMMHTTLSYEPSITLEKHTITKL